MRNKLYVVGIGPGTREYMLPGALKRIEEADVLVAGKRNLELFAELNKESFIIGNNLDKVCKYILDNIDSRKIAVIATGDPGLYSILNVLSEKLEDIDIEVVPGISSFQYLCSKLGMSWEDLAITSLHGRVQPDFFNIIGRNTKTAVFTGGGNRPEDLCKELIEKGLSNLKVTVGENLTYENERIISGTPEEISKLEFDSLSIMIIENNGVHHKTDIIWAYDNAGIPDDMFIRGSVPMTKEEVRTLSVSKLRLKEDSVVWDIGAGTGSVSVECALRCIKGKVYAIEKNSEAIDLINRNAAKFGAGILEAIYGEAPEVLKGLTEPDRIFIGGSAGKMESLLEHAGKLKKGVRVVINAVTLESAYEAVKSLEKEAFEEIEITNISISKGRKMGDKHLMQALNPVYIISAEKRDLKS